MTRSRVFPVTRWWHRLPLACTPPRGVCIGCERRAENGGAMCRRCADESRRDSARIADLQRGGHRYHCAARIVWGDGWCECGRRSAFADPGAAL
jgi:predicted amidophosphoribosyltransferase